MIVHFKLSFHINNALQDGGGIYYSVANYGSSITSSSFSYNYAYENGGAIFLASSNGNGLYNSNNEVNIQRCMFYINVAWDGGAVFVFFQNNIMFTGTPFILNIGIINGNLLLVHDTVLLFSLKLFCNYILLGGALFLERDNTMFTYENIDFYSNIAGENGGALFSDFRNVITFDYQSTSLLNVSHNSAFNMGGGFCLLNQTVVSFGNSLFWSNYGFLGGGMVIRSAPWYIMQIDISPLTITMLENIAYRGSAIAFAELLESSSTVNSISFIRNFAHIAGTVYWLYNPQRPYVVPGLESTSLIWQNNYAPFGEKYTTQPVNGYVNSSYTVTVYNADLSPPVPLYLLDYYNKVITSDNLTLVQVSVNSSACFGYSAFLSAAVIEKARLGVANFENLRASCYPGGSMNVEFDVAVTEATFFSLQYANSFYITSYSNFVFRECVAGEILTFAACTRCTNGSYLLHFDPEETQCKRCPQQADMCYGNQIYLSAGYWRRSPYTGDN